MTYASRRTPRAKQAECAPLIRGRRAFAVRAGQRVGKSKIIVDDFGEMAEAGECLDLVVVAPGGAYRPWGERGDDGRLSAVEADLPEALAARTRVLVWDSGRARTKSRRLELEDLMAWEGPRVLVVNAEALSSVKAARDLVIKFLRQRRGKNCLVVDESVVIKQEKARVSRFVVNEAAPLAAYRRILTGLITPRSPLDLWNQFRFLDWKILGHPTFATFQARYAKVERVCMVPGAKLRGMLRSRLGLGGHLTHAELQIRARLVDPSLNAAAMTPAALRDYLETMVEVVDRNKIPDVVKALGGYVQTVPMIRGYDHVEELNQLIAPHSFRCRLEDCYDMPASDYSFWDVEMHPNQRRVYDELREFSTAELASLDHVTATHVIVKMLRLHQVLCGVAVDEEGREHEVPERRTQALVDLLSDYDGKAVVWCSYDYSVRKVSAALEEEFGEGSVARFWGGNVKTREEEEARFKSDPRCRFEVGTPDAGRFGRDWSVADLCIFYSCKNNLDHRDQGEMRLKADGKTRPVSYVDLRVPGTVEDGILRCLRQKINMADVVNGDDFREWLI